MSEIGNLYLTLILLTFGDHSKAEFKEKLGSISEELIELMSNKYDISVKDETDFNIRFATIPKI
ncbi:16019_t:CDS:2 [Racocetra fulgida]|uniref:16019_t:CDS:1 n=1 Tax=Racocetra fulgida TaxID=60492 RepID=A0A9N9FJ70_9GLOM|nr:16019_t:CDS:2 [Racocetra fulgida]